MGCTCDVYAVLDLLSQNFMQPFLMSRPSSHTVSGFY